jgi:hypothetical protein
MTGSDASWARYRVYNKGVSQPEIESRSDASPLTSRLGKEYSL